MNNFSEPQPVPVTQLVHEKQLVPSFAARIIIPAGENILVGVGVIMIAAVLWADWGALTAPVWFVNGLRLATTLTGLLFIIRFGADEVRLIIGIIAQERMMRLDRSKDALIERLQHENSLLRSALANEKSKTKNFVPSLTVQRDDAVDDALMLLNRLRNGAIPRISERTIVEKMKILSEERFKKALLVLRQAGVVIDRQGVYNGLVVDGKKRQDASLEAAIAAVRNRFFGFNVENSSEDV
jgi:hypothetical protein